MTIKVRRLLYCGAVSQVKVSADTMCLQKATDKSWVLFRTFQKKGKNRDYIELAYSQLKQLVSYSWLWYFSSNLCRQFLTKVRTATASQLNVTDTALAAVANGSGEFSEPATPLTAIWLIYLLIYLAHWPWFLWLSWHFF